MTTTLAGALKRALVVDGEPYTLTITPEGMTLVPKGRRKGYALAWADLVSGDAALATALNASLARAPGPRVTPAAPPPVTSVAKWATRPAAPPGVAQRRAKRKA